MATFKNTLDSPPTALVDMGLNAANDAVGSLINNAFYKKNAKYQFELNEQSAENAYQRQLDFWNKQNEYNDPSSQVSRLRKAGLNPATMNGGVAGNTAGGLSSVSAGSVAGAPSSSSKHIDFLTHAANRLNLEHLDYENKILSEQLKSHQSDNLRRAIEDGDYATAHQLRMQMLADDRDFKRLSNEEKENKIKSDLIDLGWKQDAVDDGINPIIDEHAATLSQTAFNDAKTLTENLLRSHTELSLILQNEADILINALNAEFGFKERNLNYQLTLSHFNEVVTKLKYLVEDRDFNKRLLAANLTESEANALRESIAAGYDNLEFEYFKSIVGNEGNWYDILPRLLYEISTDVPFSAGVSFTKK